MGKLFLTVSFPKEVPTLSAVVVALCQHTGEQVSYSEGYLSCLASGTEFELDPPEKAERGYTLASTNLGGSYLWDATLFVLHALGGVSLHQVPIWASKPWQEAKPHYQARHR